MKKNILGLDLGVTSIGWALTQEDDKGTDIIDMGSRIIPLSSDDRDEFSKGNKISKNQNRTQKRTQRKGYDRYQQRRDNLMELLNNNGMMPDSSLFSLNATQLYELRHRAISEKISEQELGRVLLHLNQKRGYKSISKIESTDKKETEYVQEVKNRHQKIQDLGLTIGSYFYQEFLKNPFYRVKSQVFPREAYIQEFDKIITCQKQFHSSILNEKTIKQLKDEIVYYQRRLKSQKSLISICEFEGKKRKNKKGEFILTGPKVAAKSSPIAQICKIWENINNISIKDKENKPYQISQEQKNNLFHLLNSKKDVSKDEIFKTLGLKKNEGWHTNSQIEKGLQGNITYAAIAKVLGTDHNLLQLALTTTTTTVVDKETGEINDALEIDSSIEQQPYYQLWHTIYSISDTQECTNALMKKFHLDEATANQLAKIDFTKDGFSNKSVKAMRKILPHLMEGNVYSSACSLAKYNHSNSITNEEKTKKILLEKLDVLPKNSLRQPVVEKILNQLINLVNNIITNYGRPDEIRIELAREIKQSREERQKQFSRNSDTERKHKKIIERIEKEYKHLGIRASRNTIIKWKLFEEINPKTDVASVNATCIYCGKQFGISDALKGDLIDVEHIIPKSKLFDDSQSNKTLVHRKCNADKNNMTAYDYMKTKSEEEFQHYLARVQQLATDKIISRAKRDKLLMPENKIPQDFISRQMRETQYMAKKAVEILSSICHKVFTTSGTITAYLRKLWGWEDVLMQLQLPKYRELGLTTIETYEHKGQKHQREVIADWSKRDDHRHHAIDALTIACTKQGYIQRINSLSAQKNREEMFSELNLGDKKQKDNLSLLDQYFLSKRPLSTAQVSDSVSRILISYKSGKKVATFSKRTIKKNGKTQVVQTNIIVPRGALSEESVYGKIKQQIANKPVKFLFENPDTIAKPKIKKLVVERLSQHDNDANAAIKSLKKEPIYLDEAKNIPLSYATCYQDSYVIKYNVETITSKDLSSIVDTRVREIIEQRINEHGGDAKAAFKDLENNPVWYNKEKQIPIKTVRMHTGLKQGTVVPVKKNSIGKNIGFVKPGNNHHIAIYTDKQGKKVEHVCTFWHAVERKKAGIPVIIKDTSALWSNILEQKEQLPAEFLEQLPPDGLLLELSLQQNEMVTAFIDEETLNTAIAQNNYALISKHLYRVQKLSSSDYNFNHHLETTSDDKNNGLMSKRQIRIRSLKSINANNIIKIKINNLGKIQRNYHD